MHGTFLMDKVRLVSDHVLEEITFLSIRISMGVQ